MLVPANMYDAYAPSGHTSEMPLENFGSLISRKYSGSYANYFTEQSYHTYHEEVGTVTASFYQELQCPKETYEPLQSAAWKSLDAWTGDDIMAWLQEVALNPMAPIHETEIPFFKFREYNGYALKMMTRGEIRQLMYFPGVSRESARQNGDVVYMALERLRADHAMPAVQARDTVLRSASGYYSEPQLHDMDQHVESGHLPYHQYPSVLHAAPHDMESDPEDRLRPRDSPDCSYGSDASKCGDENDNHRIRKRAPGRPRGSGKKPHNRVKNVSVPEFLAHLLSNPQYCPSIIKWENYKIYQFRFVKPDEVAKLWGIKKNNKNMSFEKFSRAMRYHYKNEVLKSVPSARLVYQFGVNGKHLIHRTDDPNFELYHIKLEHPS